MNKTLMILLYGLEDANRHKLFVRLLKRHAKGTILNKIKAEHKLVEVWPNAWIGKFDMRPPELQRILTASFLKTYEYDDEGLESTPNENLLVLTVMNDDQHLSGWLHREQCEWPALRALD